MYPKALYNVIILVLLTIAQATPQPEWTRKQPFSRTHYIGIGMADKTPLQNHQQVARSNALNSIAEDIAISITSKQIDIVQEENGITDEFIRSEIQTTTLLDLEGYRLIDTWEDAEQYWVYYSLSIAVFDSLRQKRIAEAGNRSLSLLKQGDTFTKTIPYANYTGALSAYLRALEPLKPYVSEPFQVELLGETVFLENEIMSRLNDLLHRIKLRASDDLLVGNVGGPIEKGLQVIAEIETPSGLMRLPHLPLDFHFLQGAGEMDNKAITDSDGVGVSRIHRIIDTNRLQIVIAQVDLSALTGSDIIADGMNQKAEMLAPPDVRFTVAVSGQPVFVDSDERNLDDKLELAILSSAIESELTSNGFDFVPNPNLADITLYIEANTRRGSTIGKMGVAYLDLTISVVNRVSGNCIFTRSLDNVKGIDLEYENAGLRAYRKAEQDLLPQLLEEMQQAIR